MIRPFSAETGHQISEIALGYPKEDCCEWHKCSASNKKTAAMFNMLEQMLLTRIWKKDRGTAEIYSSDYAMN